MTGGKSLKPMAKLGARETAVAADLAYQAAKPSVRSMQPRLHPLGQYPRHILDKAATRDVCQPLDLQPAHQREQRLGRTVFQV